jgi:hypothetical protein
MLLCCLTSSTIQENHSLPCSWTRILLRVTWGTISFQICKFSRNGCVVTLQNNIKMGQRETDVMKCTGFLYTRFQVLSAGKKRWRSQCWSSGFNVVKTCRYLPMIQRNIPLPFSALNIEAVCTYKSTGVTTLNQYGLHALWTFGSANSLTTRASEGGLCSRSHYITFFFFQWRCSPDSGLGLPYGFLDDYNDVGY